MRVINGEPLSRDDDDADLPPSKGNAPASVTAIPKAGSKDRPLGGPQPTPTA